MPILLFVVSATKRLEVPAAFWIWKAVVESVPFALTITEPVVPLPPVAPPCKTKFPPLFAPVPLWPATTLRLLPVPDDAWSTLMVRLDPLPNDRSAEAAVVVPTDKVLLK